MIITSMYKLEPGKIYTEKSFKLEGMWLWENWYNDYTFYVMREVIREDYINYCYQERPNTNRDEYTHYEFYYEISMD